MMVSVSAPGKLVLCGEHAVLKGQPAIVMAINRRMYVNIKLRNDEYVSIKSHKFGSVRYKITELEKTIRDENWYSSIFFLVKKILVQNYGADIEITSNIEDVGFGSSGSLFACVAYGLLKITMHSIISADKVKILFYILDLYKEFTKNNHNSQIPTSGIDIVASVLGGIVFFYPKKNIAENLDVDWMRQIKFTAIFTGQRTNKQLVNEIISKVKNSNMIYKKIGKIVKKVKKAIFKKKKRKILLLLKKNQKMLTKLGLSNSAITDIISQCKKKKVIAKISGSGLGDCVIAFGDVDIKGFQCFSVNIDDVGIIIE